MSEIRGLKSRLEEAKKREIVLESRFAESRKETENLKRENLASGKTRSVFEERAEMLSKELEELRRVTSEEISTITRDAQATLISLRQMESESKMLEKQVAELKDTKTTTSHDVNEFATWQMKDAEERMEDMEQDLKFLRVSNADLMRRLAESKDRADKLEALLRKKKRGSPGYMRATENWARSVHIITPNINITSTNYLTRTSRSRTQVHEHPRANRSPGTGLDINAVIHGDRVSYGDTTPPRRVDDKAEIESQRKQIRELVASVKKMSLQCDEKNRELKLMRSTMKKSPHKKKINNIKMESSIRNLFLSSRRSSGSSS